MITNETNKIYHADCFDLLPEIEDNSIDLIVTDPPWLTTDLRFDSEDQPFKRLYLEFHRILKDNGWFFLFGTVEMACDVIMLEKEKKKIWRRKFEYIWRKTSIVPQTHNTVKPFSKHEIIYAFIKTRLKKMNDLTFHRKNIRTEGEPYVREQKNWTSNAYPSEFEYENRRVPLGKDGIKKAYVHKNNGFREPTTILTFSNSCRLPKQEKTPHPTQKPEGLIETLVKGYSNEGDLILDPFLGSGTTGIACLNLNRRFIGIEKDIKYFEIAKKRIENHKKQRDLPLTSSPKHPRKTTLPHLQTITDRSKS